MEHAPCNNATKRGQKGDKKGGKKFAERGRGQLYLVSDPDKTIDNTTV